MNIKSLSFSKGRRRMNRLVFIINFDWFHLPKVCFPWFFRIEHWFIKISVFKVNVSKQLSWIFSNFDQYFLQRGRGPLLLAAHFGGIHYLNKHIFLDKVHIRQLLNYLLHLNSNMYGVFHHLYQFSKASFHFERNKSSIFVEYFKWKIGYKICGLSSGWFFILSTIFSYMV